MPLGIKCRGCTEIPFVSFGQLTIPVGGARGVSIKRPSEHLIHLAPCASMFIAGSYIDCGSEPASSFDLSDAVHMIECLPDECRAVFPALALCHLVGGNYCV